MTRLYALSSNFHSNDIEWNHFFQQSSRLVISCFLFFCFSACGHYSQHEEDRNEFNNLLSDADGNITFTRSVSGGTDIFFYGTPSGDGLNLTNLGTGKNEQPALSPDNTKIAFASRRDGNRSEIYVMNIDGTNVIRLTNNSSWDIHPTWSPDGTKLAFVSDRDGVRNIYIMSSVNGSNVTRLTTNDRNDDSPSWSPDGKEIVFSSELGSSLQSPVPRLYKIKTDGSGQILLSKTVNEHEIEPSWSSMNVIAYTRSSDADGAQIYTMKPDGTQVTKLTDGKGGWHPNWSDIGDKIAFVSDRTATLRVFTMMSDGTKIQQLITSANMEFEPDWGTSPKKPIKTQ